jgi:chemotaxis family two-component system response regulator PixG
MSEINDSFKVAIPQFVGSRQAHLFKTLKIPQFTGKLTFTCRDGGEWTFLMYLGRINYATGGKHPNKRWRRNVNYFAPNALSELAHLDPHIFKSSDFLKNWEYHLLSMLVKKNVLTPSQVNKIIRSITEEILFDLTQTMEVNFDISQKENFDTQLAFIDTEQLIVEVWQQWQSWQGAKLADRSPNKAPVIRQDDQLQKKTSPGTYKIMKKLFNGKNTLRDLHFQLNQDMVSMTKMMIPYFQLGLIELIDTDDAPFPWLNIPRKQYADGQKANITCITDQFPIIEKVKSSVIPYNYTFTSFNHGDLAIASISAEPPKLIFLDLEMISASAYNLAMELRKFPHLQDIPIILIAEDTDKIDSNSFDLAGFCDVLKKPLKQEYILDIITKHFDPHQKK